MIDRRSRQIEKIDAGHLRRSARSVLICGITAIRAVEHSILGEENETTMENEDVS
jgi:hypothetical protein